MKKKYKITYFNGLTKEYFSVQEKFQDTREAFRAGMFAKKVVCVFVGLEKKEISLTRVEEVKG